MFIRYEGSRIVAAMAASTFLWLVAATGAASAGDKAHAFRQPAEFESQDVVWMSADPDNPDFMQVTTALTRALLPHVTVRMLLQDEASLVKTRESLEQSGVPIDAVECSVDSLATFFMRDAAVYLVDDEGGLAVLDLRWSLYGLPGWCVRLYPDDQERQAQCAGYLSEDQDRFEQSLALSSNASVVSSSLFLENACIEVNGRGVLVISEPLALERNPGRSRNDLERELLGIPGVSKVIWLGEGLAQDPLEMSTISGPYVGMGAGGHTDEFVRFADPNTILLAWVDDDRVAEHPLNRINRERMEHNYDILTRSTDQNGDPFRIVRVPMPTVIERQVTLSPKEDESALWSEIYFPASEGRKAGDELTQVAAASYLNFLIANDLVLVPSFVEDGTPKAVQDQVRLAFEEVFPGRTIQFVHITPLTWNGGGLHCATLSQPKRS